MLEHFLVKRVDLEPAPPVGVSPCNATQNFQELSCSNGQSHGVRWECAPLRRLQTEMADENHLGPDLKFI